MDVEHVDASVSRIAAAIAEPARTRMLYCLLDGRARTSTELAIIAGVSPATASAHLARLKEQRLVVVVAQGKHRYYNLEGRRVASALEALSYVAGGPRARFVPRVPTRLRTARTCYDHIAGALAVSLHNRFMALGWLTTGDDGYDLTENGANALTAIRIDIDLARSLRRRFAFGCMDWSERQPHLGGALGAVLLKAALRRKWLIQDLDSRALRVTSRGRQEFRRFGVTDQS